MQGEQTVLRVFRVLILNEHSAKGGTFSSLAVRAGTGVPIRILQNCLVVRQTKCGSVLSCHGRYYCLSPTLLPTRRELKLNCSRSRPLYEIALGRPNSDRSVITSHIIRPLNKRWRSIDSSHDVAVDHSTKAVLLDCRCT